MGAAEPLLPLEATEETTEDDNLEETVKTKGARISPLKTLAQQLKPETLATIVRQINRKAVEQTVLEATQQVVQEATLQVVQETISQRTKEAIKKCVASTVAQFDIVELLKTRDVQDAVDIATAEVVRQLGQQVRQRSTSSIDAMLQQQKRQLQSTEWQKKLKGCAAEAVKTVLHKGIVTPIEKLRKELQDLQDNTQEPLYGVVTQVNDLLQLNKHLQQR